MASGPHTFTLLGVFSAEQYQGNRLAIVAVRGNALTEQRKISVAKEFGYPATVYIYDAPTSGTPRRIEMYASDGQELSLSGHCVLGSAHYVFQCCEPEVTQSREPQLTTVLMTKSGAVAVLYNPQRQVAACSLPHNFHEHKSRVSFDRIINVQPQIQIVPTVDRCKDKTFPVVSLVRGMTYVLVDLSAAPEILGALEAGKAPDVDLDEEWKQGLVGAMYYRLRGGLTQPGEPTIHSIQARMITRGIEDSGTGSGCSALACYLALNQDNANEEQPQKSEVDQLTERTANVNLAKKQAPSTKHIFAIQQGSEMGRACTIAVEVDLFRKPDGSTAIKTVTLSGRASFFAKGELMRG